MLVNRHRLYNILNCVRSQSPISFINANSKIELARKREFDKQELDTETPTALKRIIKYAKDTVPFYQELWQQAGVDLNRINTIDDLQQLPTISRNDLQQQPQSSLISKEAQQASLCSTSGTTTTPRVFLKDKTSRIHNHITALRHFADYQIPVGFTTLFVHSKPNQPISYEFRANEFLSCRIYVSIFDLLSDPRLTSYLNPDVIAGSPQILETIAQQIHFSRYGRSLKVFVSFAERLDDSTRKRIEQNTGIEVCDVYCSSEVSTLIGFECRQHSGFHINSDYVIVEVLNSEGKQAFNGESGEVVITDLCNFVSPVIRYRLGYIATASSSTTCGCGRALPVSISRIDGRVTDKIYIDGGRAFSAISLIDNLQTVTAHPITLIQQTSSSFVLKVYTSESFNIPQDQIEQVFSQHLGFQPDIDICFEQLPYALRRNQGKIRSFYSQIIKNENAVPGH